MAKPLSNYMFSALDYFNGDGILIRQNGGYWRNVDGPYVRGVTMIALIRAAALLVAEIERLDRAQANSPTKDSGDVSK